MTRATLYLADARDMETVGDRTVHLVVTSPPYPMIAMWDEMFASMGCASWEEQLQYLGRVWKECARVLVDGGIMTINIGDATRKMDGRFRLFPNHAMVIDACERIGLDTLPFILWKKPTNRPNAFLGSGFIPPNAYVTLDCEYILIFRKGEPRRFPPKDPARIASKFTKKERDVWFSQIWDVRGARQVSKGIDRRTAAFSEDIPRRLVRMFSCKGETILDPFLGTGTTMKVALALGRRCIGFESDECLLPYIKRKVGAGRGLTVVRSKNRC